VNRTVNYGTLNRYDAVHRGVNYSNVRRNNIDVHNTTVMKNDRPVVNNKVIQRNVNTTDSRMDSYRGHAAEAQKPSSPQGNRPAYQPALQQHERPESPAFGGKSGGFDPRKESQRGQASRTEMSRPAPNRTQSSRPQPASKPSSQLGSKGHDGRPK
jgi:hypothetical protein